MILRIPKPGARLVDPRCALFFALLAFGCDHSDDAVDAGAGEAEADACGGDGHGGEPGDGEEDLGPHNACGLHGPLPVEVCNGIDDNCDGEIDEGVLNACGECGAAPQEVCNGIDDDCDGEIDEGVLNACGECGAAPQEVCNGIDDDCDGEVDDGVANACGGCGPVPAEACNPEGGGDGVDDDCDGEVDEGCPTRCEVAGDGPFVGVWRAPASALAQDVADQRRGTLRLPRIDTAPDADDYEVDGGAARDGASIVVEGEGRFYADGIDVPPSNVVHVSVSALLEDIDGLAEGLLRVTARYEDRVPSEHLLFFTTEEPVAAVSFEFETAIDGTFVGYDVGVDFTELAAARLSPPTISVATAYAPELEVASPAHDTGSPCSRVLAARVLGANAPGTDVTVAVRLDDEPAWLTVDEADDQAQRVALRLGLRSDDPLRSPSVDAVEIVYGHRAGRVHGTVTHAGNGAVVRGASIELDDGRLLRADAAGRFEAFVTPGEGHLNVTRALFSPLLADFEVEPDGAVEMDIELSPTGAWPQGSGDAGGARMQPAIGRIDGRPELLWRTPIGGAYPSSVVVVDVNGDGDQEVLSIENERVIVRLATGEVVWETAVAGANTLLAVTDIEQDGRLEIVLGSEPSAGTPNGLRAARLTILDARAGGVRFRRLLADEAPGEIGGLRPNWAKVVDLDGDGRPEVVVAPPRHGGVDVYHFDDGVENAAIRWSSRFDLNGPTWYVLAVGDVDGDGVKDAVVKADRRLYVLDGRDGIARPSPEIDGGAVEGSLFLDDLDGDEDDEIVFLGVGDRGLWVLDVRPRFTPEDQEGIFVRSAQPVPTTPSTIEDALGDFDGDGVPEIVYHASRELLVRDPLTGVVKLRMADSRPRGAADFDGDGVLDLLVFNSSPWGLSVVGVAQAGDDLGVKASLAGVGYGTFNHGRSERRSRSDRDRHTHRAEVGIGTTAAMLTASIADLDGDDLPEVLTWDVSRRRLTVLEMDGESFAVRWRSQPTAAFFFPPVNAAGRDDDGESFVVVAAADGQIHGIDDGGQSRWAVDGARRLGAPLVGDLDGDGTNEVVIRGAEPRSSRRVAHGPVRVFDAREATPDVAPVAVPFAYEGLVDGERHLALADLDGAPGMEVLAATRARRLGALAGDGALLWETGNQRFPVARVAAARTDDPAHATPLMNLDDGRFVSLNAETGATLAVGSHGRVNGSAAADADHDGLADLFATSGSSLLAVEGGGLAKRDSGALGGYTAGGAVLAADCDGDGSDEILSSGFDTVFCAETSGQVRWTLEARAGWRNHLAAAGDLDGDGADDLVQSGNLGVAAFDGRTGRTLWRFAPEGGDAQSHASLCDLDGDGDLEVLVAGHDGVLRALDGSSGEVAWALPIGGLPGAPIAADVNGDGLVEILLAVDGELRAYGR